MKAGVKVSTRKEKAIIEAALADPKVLDFVRTIGEIKQMANPNLRDHAMKFYDSILSDKPATTA